MSTTQAIIIAGVFLAGLLGLAGIITLAVCDDRATQRRIGQCYQELREAERRAFGP